jgi:recombination protein RecT
MSDPQTVGQAVEQVAAPKMITPELFAQVLPQHIGAEKFTRWALTVLRKPELAIAARTDEGRLSIMAALMDCASLGLEPGRDYHLVPFKGVITGITDYKGEIKLISNANPGASVIAQLVREHDDFSMLGANVPPKHDADWFGDRGAVIGGYAYVDFGNRYSLVCRMPETEFLHHKAKAQAKNVWDEWPEAMRLKTLVHQLRRWVAWSPELKDQR